MSFTDVGVMSEICFDLRLEFRFGYVLIYVSFMFGIPFRLCFDLRLIYVLD
jgi:hypothetical protein